MKKVICAYCKVVIGENSSGGHGTCIPCAKIECAKVGFAFIPNEEEEDE